MFQLSPYDSALDDICYNILDLFCTTTVEKDFSGVLFSESTDRTCQWQWIPEGSVVFSYGRHYEIFFELELRKITSNCCFIFGLNDMEQSQKTQLRLSELCAKSRRAKINGTTGEESNKYTTDYLMDLNDLGKVEILRMDIEGDGMDSLPEFLEKHHPAQILTTMHYSPPKMASLLNLFSRQGYWLFSHEIDGMFHDICAFSFIHISGFTRYGAVPLARFLS
ncbi:hypothetical protein Y032_0197g1578 [Ancylostoma ceylanicum]|uniref:Methyltransferase domain-containing protein n=1 Tax=Ancylostoma ceylanicum TaxID=53326 RepID=A0A016SNJ5_9BILA|nr:hypothetical protein Y032_0197g1578 [Ancylostoma ceylanicum]